MTKDPFWLRNAVYMAGLSQEKKVHFIDSSDDLTTFCGIQLIPGIAFVGGRYWKMVTCKKCKKAIKSVDERN